MNRAKTIEDFGITIGTLPKGARNAITDVPGVLVGHETIDTPSHKTGVTVILPGTPNPFLHKQTAAVHVLNGFGKTVGLMQMKELGTLESPIALTNTLNVGLVQDGLIDYVLAQCEKESFYPQSINTLVGECNDGELNDIRHRAIGQKEVLSALQKAGEDFVQGDVGAGKGTICYGWKGGIGSASRLIEIDKKTYTLGVLVQSNYGNSQDLAINGQSIIGHQKKVLGQTPGEEAQEGIDRGSIMMVLATDLPVDSRQLERIIKRMSVGMARLGSYIGHGSGEVMLGFTTANPVQHQESREVLGVKTLREGLLNHAFRAAGECCEEAIVKSMLLAGAVTGHQGKKVPSLGEFLTAYPLN